MPTIDLTAPDGTKYTLTPPEGSTPEQIQAGIKQFIASHGAKTAVPTGKGVDMAKVPPELREEVKAEYGQGTQPDIDPAMVALDAARGLVTAGPVGAAEEALRSAVTQKVGMMSARKGGELASKVTDSPTLQKGAALASAIAVPTLLHGAGSAVKRSLTGELDLAKGAQTSVTEAMEGKADLQPKIEDAKLTAAKEVAKIEKPAVLRETVQQSMPPATAPSAYEAGTMLPTSETAAKEAQVYEHLTAPVRRTTDAWAEKRDALLGPMKEQELEAPHVAAAVQGQQEWLAQNNRAVSPAVRKLMGQANDLVKPPELPPELAGLSPEAQQAALAQLGQQVPKVTVSKLLGLQSQAKTLARTLKAPTDRAVAHSISDAVDESLAAIDTPSLRPLNEQYWAFRNRFPGNYTRMMSNPTNTDDIAKSIFDTPDRAVPLIQTMTPDEQKTLRGIYGQWALNTDLKAVKEAHRPAVTALFKNTPLGSPEGFTNVVTKEMAFEDLLQRSPAVQKQLADAMNGANKEIQEDLYRKIASSGLTSAKQMGPLGKQITERIRAAKTPQEQAQIVMRDLDGVTPDQAGIASIQAGRTEGPKGKLEWTKARAPLYAAMVAMGMAVGRHVSPYIGGMAVLGAGMGVRSMVRDAFIKSLEDPQKAQAFWNAINAPARPGAVAAIGRQVARLGPAATAALATGAPQQAEQHESTKPTPMTKDYYRSQATNALGGHEADTADVDRTAKLYADMGKGKTPDVQKDLRTGQLSVPSIKQGLRVTQQNAPNLLKYLNPEQAMSMYLTGSEQDRQWVRPLLEKKLQAVAGDPQAPPQAKQQAQQYLQQLGGQGG